MMNKTRMNGFTLIELVMVIVIIGILAAFALPKFVDMGGNARASVFESTVGSVRSAIAITHSKALASRKTGASETIKIEGGTVDMGYGYPSLAGIASGIQIDSDDISYDSTTGIFTVGACTATYTAAADKDTPASIAVTTAPIDNEC